MLCALGALAVLLALAWNDRLVAMLNAGQAVSYHFADIVAFARALVLGAGIALLGLAALAYWRRRPLSAWMRRHRMTLLGIATLCVTLLVLLALGELAARVMLRGETYDGGGAGLKDELASIALNSRGFRDQEYPVEKGDATVILVLGDSFTFGQGIKDTSDVWTEVLERDLRAAGQDVRVINTGQNGFQTYDEWRTLNASLDLQPDLVILQYFFNDAETDAQLTHPVTARLGPWGKLTKGMHLFLYSNSYLYSFIYVRWQNAKINLGLVESYPDAINDVYATHGDELAIHTQQLLGVKETAERNSARFLLLVTPANYDFTDYPLRDGHAFIASFCTTYDVPCLDLLPAFEGEDYTRMRVSPYDAHPSVYGHARIAHAIEEAAIFKSLLRAPEGHGEEQVVPR